MNYRSKILLLLVIVPLLTHAQEQSHPTDQLDKTYGYIKSHELLAYKIKQRYPNLALRIDGATQDLYANFGKGLQSLDQQIRVKYQNRFPEISNKLLDLSSDTFRNLSELEAEKFLHRYELMAQGRIKSPYLDVLLHQQYGKLSLVPYFKNFNQRYSVSNFSKDELIQIQLKIPNNWSEQSNKEHGLVLKKFRNNLGEGTIILNIVKTAEERTSKKTSTVETLLNELIPKDAIIRQSTKKSMGKRFAYYVNFTDQQAAINSNLKRNVSLYLLEEAGQFLILDFSIYAPNEDTITITNDIQGLFDQIVSTVQISKRPYKKSLVSNKH